MILKNLKKALILGVILAQLMTSNVLANTSGTVNDKHVNVRSEASTNAKVIEQKNTGDKVDIISKEGDWYKIQLKDNKVAYMFAKYITQDVVKKADPVKKPVAPVVTKTQVVIVTPVAVVSVTPSAVEVGTSGTAVSVEAVTTSVAITATPAGIAEVNKPAPIIVEKTVQLVVTTDILNFRSSPDLSSKANIIDKLSRGNRVTVIEDAGEWYKVSAESGLIGYVFKEYVQVYQTPVISEDATQLQKDVVAFAMQYVGLAYRAGGTNLGSGVDCSGFTYAVMKEFGITLNRSSGSQSDNGIAVAYADLQLGDLIFFGYSGNISHVGIYIGNGKMIHATTVERGVAIDISSSCGGKKVIACRRVIY